MNKEKLFRGLIKLKRNFKMLYAYVLKKKIEWDHLQGIVVIKKEELIWGWIKSSSRRATTRGYGLSLVYILWFVNMDMKICLKRGSPIVVYGEKFARLHQASSIKKSVSSWVGQDRHHQDQVDAQGKDLLLVGFWFYRSHVFVGRLGYRLVCRTIKRGLSSE
jgi:hypothetical protein